MCQASLRIATCRKGELISWGMIQMRESVRPNALGRIVDSLAVNFTVIIVSAVVSPSHLIFTHPLSRVSHDKKLLGLLSFTNPPCLGLHHRR